MSLLRKFTPEERLLLVDSELRPMGKILWHNLNELNEKQALHPFLQRLELGWKTQTGGILFERSQPDPDVWWAHIYTPDCLPNLRRLWWLLEQCSKRGCHYVGCEPNNQSRPLVDRLGFECINADSDVWGMML